MEPEELGPKTRLRPHLSRECSRSPFSFSFLETHLLLLKTKDRVASEAVEGKPTVLSSHSENEVFSDSMDKQSPRGGGGRRTASPKQGSELRLQESSRRRCGHRQCIKNKASRESVVNYEKDVNSLGRKRVFWDPRTLQRGPRVLTMTLVCMIWQLWVGGRQAPGSLPGLEVSPPICSLAGLSRPCDCTGTPFPGLRTGNKNTKMK